MKPEEMRDDIPMDVRGILEQARRQLVGATTREELIAAACNAEIAISEALDAEGVGLPWKPAPPMRERRSMPSVVLWRSLEGHQFQVAPSEFGALWASHYCELSALIPLPGQSQEPSAGLRDVFDEFRDALRPLRADEEQSHD